MDCAGLSRGCGYCDASFTIVCVDASVGGGAFQLHAAALDRGYVVAWGSYVEGDLLSIGGVAAGGGLSRALARKEVRGSRTGNTLCGSERGWKQSPEATLICASLPF